MATGLLFASMLITGIAAVYSIREGYVILVPVHVAMIGMQFVLLYIMYGAD